MPHFLSWIIVVAIVHDALTSTGVINEILMSLKIVEKPYPFLQIEGWFWPIVTFSHLWKETGWNAIIYLAAITSIDPCLYESASIDGAGRFQKIKYVTLPGIRPTIMILLLMNLGNVLNAGFEIQYLLGNDLVRDVSRTIDIYILDWALDGRNMDYSLGTAAGIFKTLVAMTFIVVSNYIAKKRGDERLF
jgi:putative aldouronate transport system permease protein